MNNHVEDLHDLDDESEEEVIDEVAPDEVIQPTETKHEMFSRIMTRRKKSAIKHLLYIRKLSSTTSYEFTQEEVDAHFEDIQRALDIVKGRFNIVFEEKHIYDQFGI